MKNLTHFHHIVPKHMGGTDDPLNLIELTVEEHANAHKKLWEEHGRWQDEFAWKLLDGQIHKEERNRQLSSLANKGNKYRLGKFHTEESKQKNALSNSKKWRITDPLGNEFIVTNLFNFCRENNLQQASMWRVSVGKQKFHKKWKCKVYV